MKKIFFSPFILLITSVAIAQTYPDPEFSKEVYWLKKDSTHTVIRLEKGNSKMETKTKMGGMGGSESNYILDGGKSTARLSNYKNLSFVFSTGFFVGKSSYSDLDFMMWAY